MAFLIIANAWLKLYIEQKSQECSSLSNDNRSKYNQLCMSLTGPGGTRKTYVIGGLTKLMISYNSKHRIQYLAPTGGAAKLIGGMTLHKGLGIAIKQKNKGKGSHKPGEISEDYTVLVNLNKIRQLHDEWKFVDVLFLDEVGAVGAQLLSELDHALRITKEEPNIWFDGMIVIFAGDCHQHSPVSETPLYQPISNTENQSNTEISKQLG